MNLNFIKKNTLTVLLGSVLFLILVVPIVVYWWNFKDYVRSDDPTHWGVFGDYIGGVLNPFIAFLNLFILYYLTLHVSEQDKKTALNEFRYNAHADFSKLLHTFDPYNFTVDEVKSLLKDVNSLHFNNQFLFLKRDKEIYDELTATLRIIIHGLHAYKTTYEKEMGAANVYKVSSEKIEHPNAAAHIDSLKNLEGFTFQRTILLRFIQCVMIDGDRKIYENWDIRKFMEEREANNAI